MLLNFCVCLAVWTSDPSIISKRKLKKKLFFSIFEIIFKQTVYTLAYPKSVKNPDFFVTLKICKKVKSIQFLKVTH